MRRYFSGSSLAHSLRRPRFERLEQRQMLTVTVDTLIDEADGSIIDGDISLRDAIANAPAGETIDFSVTGTINLTLGQLVIFKDLTISGPGSGQLTIDAAGNDATPGTPDGMGTRIFLINDFDSGNDLNVAIGGVTLQNGDTSAPGGAIYNRENLSISNSVLSGNTSNNSGGALFSDGAALAIASSTIDQNTAKNGGGGVSARQFLSLTLSNSTISNNMTTGDFYSGGGIDAQSPQSNAVIAVSDSTISSNTSNRDDGGGLYFDVSASTQVSITNTTIALNSAGSSSSDEGGGTYIRNGTVSIEASRITGNSAGAFGGGAFLASATAFINDSTIDANESQYFIGDGLWSSGTTTITNSTISGNLGTGVVFNNSSSSILHSTIVDNTGTGVFFGTPSDTTIQGTVANSIIARNGTDVWGTIRSDYNLIEAVGSATLVGVGNILGVDPLLGPLQDNGGPTPTHELLTGSPAIDAGDPAAVANLNGVPEFDQRGTGFPRVEDGDSSDGPRIDIGAFEVASVLPSPSADFDLDGDIDGFDFLAWQRGNGTPMPLATKADGDADNDTDVDVNDIAVWQATYGFQGPPPVNALFADHNNQESALATAQLSPQLVDLALTTSEPISTVSDRESNLLVEEAFSEYALTETPNRQYISAELSENDVSDLSISENSEDESEAEEASLENELFPAIL